VVVALPTGGFEGWTIACAYVAQPGADVRPALLRQRLSNLLPSYMLPARWRELETLPRTSNGKADRRSVSELFGANA
jgi:acyl-coenzyme A synthetase/AMP-(fatty) acid ligase